ncbi:MAG: putative DNA-binding domain-containing protein [Nitrospinae bacterium]|nr:putative DNA-binding domain-containing protein [Nitrospinota bacterium]
MRFLRELQRDFMEAVYGGDESGFARKAVADEFSGRERLRLYRHIAFGNMTDALRAAYPVVEQLVGKEFFDGAAWEFIRRYPSRSGDLHDFGAEFAGFLSRFPSAAILEYLPDVARLEWACHKVFFAADRDAFPLDRLAQVPQSRYGHLRFKLNPACRLVRSRFPIRRIWEIHQPDYRGERTVDLNEGGADLLVRRRERVIGLFPLGPGEWDFLSALGAEQTFSKACGGVLIKNPGFDVAGRLRHFVADAILVDFYDERKRRGKSKSA